MAGKRDSLENKEIRPVDSQDVYTTAIQNKMFMDNAIRVAVDNAQRNVGIETFTCYLCGKHKNKSEFYSSTDRRSVTGVSRICKECARKIARQTIDGAEENITAESLYEMCEYLDIPWIYSVYGGAIERHKSEPSIEVDDSYNTLIANEKYMGMRFKDSEALNPIDTVKAENSKEDSLEQEYEYNRNDVIRFAGYDPYLNYPIEEDKPRLYAQLISLMDEETRNDGMKMGAVLQIVKNLNQAQKLSDQIDLLVNDTKNVSKNMAVIDRMTAAAKKLLDAANALAKDNGVSVNFNNNKAAGASTLSGKIKKLTEIGFRNAQINLFDIGTCEGMRQVAEISEETRHKRLGYDDNIASEIKDIKVELVEQAQKERDEAKELCRKVLLENKDLKDYMKSKGYMDEKGRVIDNA